MGLKERTQAVRGKTLMTSFFAAEMLDTGMTKLVVGHLGGREINPVGVELMNNLGTDGAFILKTALTAFLIGMYALASDHNLKAAGIDFKYGLERSLQWGNLMLWGIVAWNSVNLLPYVADRLT